MNLINDFKANISKNIEITDLGELHWLLGIEVKHDRQSRTIHLSQCLYLDSIIRCYGFQDLKLVSIPMDTNIRLTTAQSPSTTADFALMRDVPYCEAVGSLMYAALGTCPVMSTGAVHEWSKLDLFLPCDDQMTRVSPWLRAGSQEACQPRGVKAMAQMSEPHPATLNRRSIG